MRLCPINFIQCILVSTRLSRRYPLHRRQVARPRYRDALTASFRAMAPGVVGSRGLAFFRSGMTAFGNRVVAFARVVRPIGGCGPDVLIGRDLVEQLGQPWRFTDITGGNLHGPDFQRFSVNPYVYLVPNASLRATLPTHVPLALTFGFDACAVDQKI